MTEIPASRMMFSANTELYNEIIDGRVHGAVYHCQYGVQTSDVRRIFRLGQKGAFQGALAALEVQGALEVPKAPPATFIRKKNCPTKKEVKFLAASRTS